MTEQKQRKYLAIFLLLGVIASFATEVSVRVDVNIDNDDSDSTHNGDHDGSNQPQTVMYPIFTSRLSQGVPGIYAFPCDNDVDPQTGPPFGLRGGFVFPKAATLRTFHIKADSAIHSVNSLQDSNSTAIEVPIVLYINDMAAGTIGIIPANDTFNVFNEPGLSIHFASTDRIAFALNLTNAASGDLGNFQAAFEFSLP
jgi:hypothetical protein